MNYRPILQNLYKAIEDGKTGEDLSIFFTDNAEQVEFPSLMRPEGSTRPLADMLAASELGQKILSDQNYEILNYLEDGKKAATQLTWTATLAMDVGKFTKGQKLTAHVAAFYEFSDDKIVRQSSYDCYEQLSDSASTG